MRCLSCNVENASHGNFCINCGAPQAKNCDSCNAQNIPQAKFCNVCGTSFSGDSPDGVAARRAFSLTKRPGESDNPSFCEGERKTITALFADLRGSTELIRGLDPEDARAIIDPALRRMMDSVSRYGGYVVQSAGDGIFALFGAPIAYEDHPQRAIHAALEIQKEIKRLAPKTGTLQDITIEARVGLDTGEVVLREIETTGGTEYTPIGLAANLAARIQNLAMPGAIVVTDRLRKLAEGYFQFTNLGPANVKGLIDSIAIHQVIGAGPLRTRFQAAVQRGLSLFVGREAEIKQLENAFEQMKTGHGQVVTVVGSPGVGKSRLLFEFKHLHQQDCVIMEGLSISHGKAHAYLPVVEMLKDYFAIGDQDDDVIRHRKIEQRLLALDANFQTTVPYISGLLTGASTNGEAMRGEVGQRRLRDAIKRLVLRESINQPLIVVFEDLQWIDQETQHFLDLLVDSIASARVLLLFNSRPEYRDEWGGKSYYTRLRLDPLDDRKVDELLSGILDDSTGLTALKRLVLEQSEGNPLFIEEIVQTLFEHGLLDSNSSMRLNRRLMQIHIPSTIQGVLAARIDRLPPAEKSLLQTLAVIGKTFSMALIKRLVQIADDRLETLLYNLQIREFIYEEPGHIDSTYSLKHSLTLEVAYNSLLIERRKVLHGQTAVAIESLFASRLDDHLMELAHHYRWGGNVQRAVHYFQREAIRINSIGLGRQAVETGLEAISLLGLDLPNDPLIIGPRIAQECQQIEELLDQRSPADLLSLPSVSAEIAPVIEPLLIIGPFAFQSLQPDLFALMAHVALRITLQTGNGPLSPDVYSMYSVVYGAQTHKRAEAFAFSRLAIDLDARYGQKLLGRVGFVHTWFHNHWVNPLRSNLEITLRSSDAAFEAGDVTFGCYNLAADVTYKAAAGFPLLDVIDTAKAHLRRNDGRIMEVTFICILEMQIAKALAGVTADPLVLSDVDYDEERDLASITSSDQANQIAQYFVFRSKLHYWFGDVVGALVWAEKARPISQSFSGEVIETELTFFHGLALAERVRQAPANEKASLLDAAGTDRETLSRWAYNCSNNFLHKVHLLEAEIRSADGLTVDDLYNNAAKEAHDARFIQYEALAYERWGASLFEKGDRGHGREILRNACEAYSNWGARAKVNQIEKKYWDCPAA
jgi:predicted ATPase/class 3 adenylate cyclase